jgi:hypothetical protein
MIEEIFPIQGQIVTSKLLSKNNNNSTYYDRKAINQENL